MERDLGSPRYVTFSILLTFQKKQSSHKTELCVCCVPMASSTEPSSTCGLADPAPAVCELSSLLSRHVGSPSLFCYLAHLSVKTFVSGTEGPSPCLSQSQPLSCRSLQGEFSTCHSSPSSCPGGQSRRRAVTVTPHLCQAHGAASLPHPHSDLGGGCCESPTPWMGN